MGSCFLGAVPCRVRLDRLSRSVAFIATLMDARGFDLADMSGANRLTLHVLAAAAEYERHMIGKADFPHRSASRTLAPGAEDVVFPFGCTSGQDDLQLFIRAMSGRRLAIRPSNRSSPAS
jgi:hypothetical protein